MFLALAIRCKKLSDGGTAVALVNFGVFDGQHYNATFTVRMFVAFPGVLNHKKMKSPLISAF